MTFKIRSILFCDDVRKEVTGKYIIIGVYTADVTVNQYPVDFLLSLWVELEFEELGSYEIDMRIISPSGNPPVEVNFTANINHGRISSVAIRALPIRLERDGEIEVVVKNSSGIWLVEKTIEVRRQT